MGQGHREKEKKKLFKLTCNKWESDATRRGVSQGVFADLELQSPGNGLLRWWSVCIK